MIVVLIGGDEDIAHCTFLPKQSSPPSVALNLYVLLSIIPAGSAQEVTGPDIMMLKYSPTSTMNNFSVFGMIPPRNLGGFCSQVPPYSA